MNDNDILLDKMTNTKSDYHKKTLEQDWQQRQRYADIVKAGRTMQEMMVLQTKR